MNLKPEKGVFACETARESERHSLGCVKSKKSPVWLNYRGKFGIHYSGIYCKSATNALRLKIKNKKNSLPNPLISVLSHYVQEVHEIAFFFFGMFEGYFLVRIQSIAAKTCVDCDDEKLKFSLFSI